MSSKPVVFLAIFLVALALVFSWLDEPSFEQAFWNASEAPAAKQISKFKTKQSNLEGTVKDFESAKDFLAWQARTRAAYQRALHVEAVVEPAASVQLLGTAEEKRGILREYFQLVTSDGLRIPGVLQYPTQGKDLPGIIVIPGHTKAGVSGLRQLVQEEDSYQHAAATKLAQAGYATIAIELRGFGLLGTPNYPEHKIVAYNELLQGSSYKERVLSDLAAVHKYFSEKIFVDANRIGVTGASLGGELAVALAVALPSIKAIAFSSYVAQGDFVGFDASARKQPHYCHLIPGVGQFMRKEDVFKLLAPRPTKGIRETKYKNQYQNVVNDLRNTWLLLDSPQNFEFEQIENGKHQFYLQEAIDFFNRYL